jgi:hypothetical protein
LKVTEMPPRMAWTAIDARMRPMRRDPERDDIGEK